MNKNTHIVAGLILLFIAYYTGVEWFPPAQTSQLDSVAFFTWITNLFSSIIPLFLALFAGILIQKGVAKK